MMKDRKKEIVKNIIIVFLVAMLLLTLFSNTIMNSSLPEVAVQGSEGGTITTQLSLTGTVSANKIQQVTLEEARIVNEVLVRRGQRVERGEVLATLIEGEGPDTFELEIALKRLEIEYKQLLVSQPDSLVTQKRLLEDSQKELSTLEEYMVKYPALDMAKKDLEARLELLENDLDKVGDNIADLEKEIKKYQQTEYTDMDKLKDAIERAEDKLNAAEKAMDSAYKISKKMQTAYNNANTFFALADSRYTEAVKDREEIEEKITAIEKNIISLEGKRAEKNAQIEAAEAAGQDTTQLQEELSAIEASLSTQNGNLRTERANLDEAEAEEADALTNFNEKSAALGVAYTNYTSAKNAAEAAEADYNARYNEVERLNGGFEYALLYTRLEDYMGQKDEITDEKEEVEELLKEAAEALPKTMEECEAEKLKLTRTIEDCESAIALAGQNGEIEDQTHELNLQIKLAEIDKKKKELAKIREETKSTDIKATVSGTITAVNIVSGDEVQKDTIVFEITVNDLGYTMECSVPNSQATRLTVGQTAEVKYYYYGEKPVIRISQIVSDPSSHGKNKLITFTVEGEVSEGETLNIALGTSNARYDTIVPNSAIREDANGKFVLKVVAKDSPLGNRYFAERLDVSVLASDATKSAIDASLSWGDYIITSSSVPISDGMQVRMSE